MSLTIFQNEKTPLQAIKTRSSRSRKIDIFPKGLSHGFGPNVAMFPAFFQAKKIDIFPKELTHGFCPNMAILPTFFFHLIQVTKMSFTIFQKVKKAFQAIKTRSLKSRKTDTFPKRLSHGFGPNMAIFSTFFFLGNIGYRNVFYHILDRKNAYLGCKNEKHNKSKN